MRYLILKNGIVISQKDSHIDASNEYELQKLEAKRTCSIAMVKVEKSSNIFFEKSKV